MDVNYEKLLQDSNQVKNYIKTDIAQTNDAILTRKPNPKKWSAIEVVEHLNRVYDIYLDNFRNAVENAEALPDHATTTKKRTILGRLSTYSMKPKGKKVKFKMKTFDFFRPAVAPQQKNEVIETFLKNKEVFNELIKKARTKKLENVKIPTALGKRVKFYVPECFEFILAHEERHMVQIEEALK